VARLHWWALVVAARFGFRQAEHLDPVPTQGEAMAETTISITLPAQPETPDDLPLVNDWAADTWADPDISFALTELADFRVPVSAPVQHASRELGSWLRQWSFASQLPALMPELPLGTAPVGVRRPWSNIALGVTPDGPKDLPLEQSGYWLAETDYFLALDALGVRRAGSSDSFQGMPMPNAGTPMPRWWAAAVALELDRRRTGEPSRTQQVRLDRALGGDLRTRQALWPELTRYAGTANRHLSSGAATNVALPRHQVVTLQ
jgi:hypothetical protein